MPLERVLETPVTAEEHHWQKEYEKIQILPSTTRRTPSKALLAFAEILALRYEKQVLDAGCGNGRNAFYVASLGSRVCGIDFCGAALSKAREAISSQTVRGRAQLLRHNLHSRLPLADSSFDVALDVYTSCHFLEVDKFSKFWREMYRVTKTGGQLLCVGFSPSDEYYARFLSEPSQRVVVDPSNGIAKKLYTEEELREVFDGLGKPELLIKLRFDDLVAGSSYRRDIYALGLRKV